MAAQPAPEPVSEPATAEVNVEHLGPGRIRCGCPRHVNVRSHVVVVLRHRDGCEVRHPAMAVPPPPEPRMPAGAIPCPECGAVAFSLTTDGRRKCQGCDHAWKPGEPARAARTAPSAAQGADADSGAPVAPEPRQRALALLGADPEG